MDDVRRAFRQRNCEGKLLRFGVLPGDDQTGGSWLDPGALESNQIARSQARIETYCHHVTKEGRAVLEEANFFVVGEPACARVDAA